MHASSCRGKPRQRGPSCPWHPWRVQLPPLLGGEVTSCHAAQYLMPDFSPVQPQFQLCKTGTEEWPNWVLSPSPAPHGGSGHARTHQRHHCVPWGGWQGWGTSMPPSPMKAVQHNQSLGSCARNGFGFFPLLELPGSGAKWQIPRCPGSCSICRDNLALLEPLSSQRKKQSTQIKNSNLEEARSCYPGLSCVGMGEGGEVTPAPVSPSPAG